MVKKPSMLPAQHFETSVLFGRAIEINQHRYEVVICMREIRQILMPLNLRAHESGLQVELGMLQSEIGTKQRNDACKDSVVPGELTKHFMLLVGLL